MPKEYRAVNIYVNDKLKPKSPWYPTEEEARTYPFTFTSLDKMDDISYMIETREEEAEEETQVNKIDFFTGERGNRALSYIMIAEKISDGSKVFGYPESESLMIEELAMLTNDKHFRIHKIMLMNEEGEAKEIQIDFKNGKLRPSLKE